jgi:isocitrate/isopropylmalate dehydrogenase
MGSALRTKLLSVTDVTTLIGQRMYRNALPQKSTLPAVVFTTISTTVEHTVSDRTRLAHSRVQFDCYANSRATATAVAQAIQRSGICAYRGTTDSIYFCGTQIDSGDYESEEPPTDGNQEHRYVTSFDLLVHYKELA